MTKYFDVHTHLFNKHFLAKELRYRLMKEFQKFLRVAEAHDRQRGITDAVRGLKNAITALKRYRYAIRVFTSNSSIEIYEELNKTYKGEFILTPLTFDLTWCFAPSADRAMDTDSTRSVHELIDKEMEALFGEIEGNARGLSRDANPDATLAENNLWEEYTKEKEGFLQEAATLQGQYQGREVIGDPADRGIFRTPDATDGFEEQIRQLMELKNHPDYKGMIFPFLAVDPRRPGIADYARENVGKGKLFIGVKLYCPNGYSPTDPLLYGPEGERGGIYAFCEDHGIPVTAHNSDGGFATLSKSVVINGDVQFNGELHRLDNELLTFRTSILDKDAIEERALTLNHPLLWRKVVQKYPNLILNLAHFGGGQQLSAALENPTNINLWSNRIIELLKDPGYRVYTDISCFSDFDVVRKFALSPVFREIQSKILFGSDFILLLLFENDFGDNIARFKSIFGSDFDNIAGANPREFLKHVLDAG